jgi:hypothetical protein
MARTLVVGCSFVQHMHVYQDTEDFLIVGNSAAGNPSIAATVLYYCSKETFQRVIVLWSGVNRIDIPVPINLHQALPKDKNGYPKYIFYTELGDVVWYHSGGYRPDGFKDPCPKFLQDLFTNQYRGTAPNSKYLSNLTLTAIINTQSILSVQGIQCDMSFIYDVNEQLDKNSASCGPLLKDSLLYHIVDWTKFVDVEPIYNQARSRRQLTTDEFHPTPQFMINWINHTFGVTLPTRPWNQYQGLK